MTRFWIMALHGRKLVRLLPPSENHRAGATDADDFQPSLFTVDLMTPDPSKHPGLDGLLVYEVLLEAGDVLFIPEGWGHQALNLEWSLMISSNYVDQHNAGNALEWVHYEAVRCFHFPAQLLLTCAAAFRSPSGSSCALVWHLTWFSCPISALVFLSVPLQLESLRCSAG